MPFKNHAESAIPWNGKIHELLSLIHRLSHPKKAALPDQTGKGCFFFGIVGELRQQVCIYI